MKIRASLLILIMLCATGCQTASQTMVVRDKLPGQRYSNYIKTNKPHELTKSHKGVYVYKDNVIYNTTTINPHAGAFAESRPLDFGPGVIKFGPNDIQSR